MAFESDEISGQRLLEAIEASKKFFADAGIESPDFFPVIVNINPDVEDKLIDGAHRREVDPNWKAIQVNLTETQATVLKFIANFTRRRMSVAEMSTGLAAIAEKTGLNPHQISKLTGVPYSTVLRNIPDQYKRKYLFKEQPVEIEEPTEGDTESPLEPPLELPDDLSEAVVEPDEIIESEEHKTPEETIKEVLKRFPNASHQFVEAAVSREHPLELGGKTAEQIVQEVYPQRRPEMLGVNCPVCGSWKSKRLFEQRLTRMEQTDPTLVELVRGKLEEAE